MDRRHDGTEILDPGVELRNGMAGIAAVAVARRYSNRRTASRVAETFGALRIASIASRRSPETSSSVTVVVFRLAQQVAPLDEAGDHEPDAEEVAGVREQHLPLAHGCGVGGCARVSSSIQASYSWA